MKLHSSANVNIMLFFTALPSLKAFPLSLYINLGIVRGACMINNCIIPNKNNRKIKIHSCTTRGIISKHKAKPPCTCLLQTNIIGLPLIFIRSWEMLYITFAIEVIAQNDFHNKRSTKFPASYSIGYRAIYDDQLGN